MNSKNYPPLYSWIVTIFVPLALIMLGVRLLMTPMFLEMEYRMPGFPEDRFGFGLQDRLQWAKPSVGYLVNGDGIAFLAELKLTDGKPIYNERELSHMADVKGVVQSLLKIWYAGLAVLGLFGAWAWLGGWQGDYILGWKRGGYLTAGLLVVLGLFASISFWQFFTWFHSLFFSGDSWLFEYSDTLIRLFPIRFWEDAVAYIGGFSIVAGLLLGFGLKPKGK
ncbi:MAG: TIGR01906 family membrane protein [Chloroflexi bacterium]|nr:TIGR01906 family membrane protein [Chloroflexota bacterium]